MAVQAAEVTPISEVPDNSYRSASWLWISHSEIGNSFDDTEHTSTDERVLQQPFYCATVNSEVEEQKVN